MKKNILIAITLLFVLTIVSCSESIDSNSNNVDTNLQDTYKDSENVPQVKKDITADDLILAFKNANYFVATSDDFFEDFSNLTSYSCFEACREKYINEYDENISDYVSVIYLEFSDEASAIGTYNEIFTDIFSSNSTIKTGDNFSKAVLNENDGESTILSRVDNIIIFALIDWDDYTDAEIEYDSKPQSIIESLGY